MPYQFTPATERALTFGNGWTGSEDSDELAAPAVLLGLLDEPECRAAVMLAAHGIDADAVRRRWPELRPRDPSLGGVTHPSIRFSAEVELSLQMAHERLAELPQPLVLATEHVLLGLAAAGHEVSEWLSRQGVDVDALTAEIYKLYGHRPGPLTIETNDVPESPPPEGEGIAALRILDAATNRAREGLRAVEDYVRFVLDDRHLTGLCKQLRHDLAALLDRIPIEHRLAARETQADVGTGLTTSTEQSRQGTAGVLRANLARLQEGLRSLEEFGKLLDADLAAGLKQLRYRAYTLQRAVQITRSSIQRLDKARLYVLIDGRSSAEEFRALAGSLVEAGVHLIQLRDKQSDDRRLLERARLLRELTRGSNTLFIMNDRPDLAALSHADGVHVGQEELSVKDARTIVGPEALIGVSTHTIEQARQAVLDGANYIGVGPTFPSGTKQFNQFPGLDLLRAVAVEIRLPAFAIGGITPENLSDVLTTGIDRLAVSGAIAEAANPATAARSLLSVLIGQASQR